SGVEPYVNGQAWGKGQNAGDRDTQGLVEFKDDQGNVLWWFNLPRSWDSDGNEQLGTFRFKKQGNSLFISHRVPLSFVQGAVYPLMVDVTIDEQVGTSLDDGRRYTGALGFSATDTSHYIGYINHANYLVSHQFARFTGISGLSGATIDTALFKLFGTIQNTGDPLTKIRADDQAAPDAPTNASEFDDISLTTAGVDWDGILTDGVWNDSPDIKTVIQELADSYDPTVIQIIHKDDGSGTGAYNRQAARSYNWASSDAPKLHIEYTPPNTAPTITSVSDTPDPVNSGSNTTFSVDWNDADAGDLEKAHICKTNAITTQTCDGGSWADSASFTTNDPINLTYTAQDANAGTNNYYAFVCDDDNACSSSTSGTFTVNRLPDIPSSLGPTSLVDGSFDSDNTPTITFTIDDPDTNDQVKYQIQIDDSSDFGSALVDYTSVLQSEGSASFTVGQAAGSGSYTTGSENQTLSDNSYYWRVKAIDDDNAQSNYTIANSGAIAFKVDITVPTSVSVSSITPDSTTQLTVTADIAADSGAGLHSTPYFFQETSGNSGGSSSSAYQISTSFVDTGLTANTQYTYRVKAKDAVNNGSSYSSTSSAYTSAPTPTNFSGTAALSTISLSVDSFTNNTAGSSGYYFYRSGDSPNSGWIQTNSWQDTGLSCGTSYTWYVKYRNGDGTETATASLTASTSGCGGGGGSVLPPVSTTGQGNVSQDLGGEVRRTFESGQIVKAVFPSHSIKGTIVVKIEPRPKAEIIKTNPLPKNTQIIGDLVADFKALSGGKELESFEKLVSITFTYTDEQIKEVGADEKTLKIFFWDKKVSSWKALKSEVNILTNAVTAYTSHFSLFAVMGETKEKPISEMTIEELKVKIAEISAFIAQLKAQIAQLLEKEVTEEIPANYRFTINLEYGQTNDDVRYLQIFLKPQGKEIYPEGIVSGWFGPLTKKAVIHFQEKYAQDILVPWELTAGTGFVGQTTRDKINEILGN
ncbi:hypothetical protein LCGC14_0509760, partial [marine sediment metagenome]